LWPDWGRNERASRAGAQRFAFDIPHTRIAKIAVVPACLAKKGAEIATLSKMKKSFVSVL
jgi:hypothetical protein